MIFSIPNKKVYDILTDIKLVKKQYSFKDILVVMQGEDSPEEGYSHIKIVKKENFISEKEIKYLVIEKNQFLPEKTIDDLITDLEKFNKNLYVFSSGENCYESYSGFNIIEDKFLNKISIFLFFNG